LRGDEVYHDPILDAVLFDEWVLRIGKEFEVLVEMGLGLMGLGVGGETGVWNGGGPVGVEEAVVEGSREVGDVNIDGVMGMKGDLGLDLWVGEEEEEGEGENAEESEREEESGD
jgi:hypothetical protein